jgi:phage gpG-like protein
MDSAFHGSVDISQVQRALLGAVVAHRAKIGILLETIGGIMVKSMQKTFKVEGRPEKWPELSESTKQAYRRRGLSPEAHKLLQDQGDLFNSLTYEINSAKIEAKWGYGDTSEYGIYHQFGTKKMPARRFITSSSGEEILYDEDIRAVLRVIEDFTDDCFKAASLAAKV